jgi:GTP-binding protein HflX
LKDKHAGSGTKVERAVLVAAKFAGDSLAGVQESLLELEKLAASAGAQVVDRLIHERKAPDPRFFIGPGKVMELRDSMRARADLLIFDADLSGSQQRNLEDTLGLKVLDRTELILDIFAQRARTREGMAQVELAQLEYSLSRLVGRGRSLSRLGGGIGTRGPGETKLESHRRRIRRRMVQIRRRLEAVRRTRRIMRRSRLRLGLPVICLVGYTNAGKSTLFNALTRANAVVGDRLFATLDPMVRQMHLGNGQAALLFDTVGFIRKLPPQLIHAFRATLEELLTADLLLHVVDASHPQREEQIRAVEQVLGEIGAAEKPILLVYNKMDRLSQDAQPGRSEPGSRPIQVSALTGEGIGKLREQIASFLSSSSSMPGRKMILTG